jgi:putative transposase
MRAKVTYPGAYHHIMNRGIRGENILYGDKMKLDFLKILNQKAKLHRVKIFAYCVMDNHYHLVIEDSESRLSDFMKHLNGHYGKNYRSKVRGKGYVFQGRYKSILIQDDSYLMMVIAYVLLNPIRANSVDNVDNYPWSSIREYFTNELSKITCNDYVEKLFQSKENLWSFLSDWIGKELPVKKSRYGNFLGGDEFIQGSLDKFNRRRHNKESYRKRKKDYVLRTPNEVVRNFEDEISRKIEDIKVHTKKGKNLRNKLLIMLREEAGLKYSEIIKYKPFRSLKYSSLGKLYKRAKEEISEGKL